MPIKFSQYREFQPAKRAYAQGEEMRQWAFNREAQADLCVELATELRVEYELMARVHARRNWYLYPNTAIR